MACRATAESSTISTRIFCVAFIACVDTLMDGLQTVTDPEKALGMPDHEVAARSQLPGELLHRVARDARSK